MRSARRSLNGAIKTSSGAVETGEIIDDFADQDMSEYSGATASWSFSTSTVASGTAATYQVNSSAAADAVRNTSVTTQQGETYQCFMRIAGNSVPDGNVNFTIGNQGSGTASDAFNDWDCYLIQASYESGQFELLKYTNGGGGGTSLATDSTTPLTDDWMRVTFDWATDGTLTATVFDSSESQIASLSATDTTWTSGGYGLFTDDDSEGVNQYLDRIERV